MSASPAGRAATTALALLTLAMLALPVTVRAASRPPDKLRTSIIFSVSSGGVAGNGDSGGSPTARIARPTDPFLDILDTFTDRLSDPTRPGVSAGGHVVAFHSSADNLVPGDTNGVVDVFAREALTGRTVRVSVGSDGRQADGSSFAPVVSADGRYVAFESFAANLVPGDDHSCVDGNYAAEHAVRLLRDPSGGSGLATRFNCLDVFVHDLRTGHTSRVSIPADGLPRAAASWGPALSADGRHVAFVSSDDLTAPPPDAPVSSSATQVHVVDRDADADGIMDEGEPGAVTIALASAGSVAPGSPVVPGDGASHLPSISADGSLVGFHSFATNLAAGDRPDFADVFVHDRLTKTTQLASLGPDGTAMPLDDRTHSAVAQTTAGPVAVFGAFDSEEIPARVRVYHRHLASGITEAVSPQTAATHIWSDGPALSSDGRWMSYLRDVGAQTQAVRRDLATGTDELVSVNDAGELSDSSVVGALISPDGSCVVFATASTNLGGVDENGVTDVFRHCPSPQPPLYDSSGSDYTYVPDAAGLATWRADASGDRFDGRLSASSEVTSGADASAWVHSPVGEVLGGLEGAAAGAARVTARGWVREHLLVSPGRYRIAVTYDNVRLHRAVEASRPSAATGTRTSVHTFAADGCPGDCQPDDRPPPPDASAANQATVVECIGDDECSVPLVEHLFEVTSASGLIVVWSAAEAWSSTDVPGRASSSVQATVTRLDVTPA